MWKITIGGGEETRVLDSVDCAGQWTVGGQGIYFLTTTDEKGRHDIRLHEFATGKIRKILTIKGGLESTSRFPPTVERFFTRKGMSQAAT